MYIDIEALRADMLNSGLGAYFGGGFGGGLMEACNIECASEDELISMATEAGIDLSNYEVDN